MRNGGPPGRLRPGFSLVVLCVVTLLHLSACRPGPPVIESFTVRPTQGDAGGFVIVSGVVTLEAKGRNLSRVDFLIAPTGTGVQPALLCSDATPRDGFTCHWLVAETENILAHVWAVGYDSRGESVETQVVGVYHEAPAGPCPPGG